jgi:hypothetical protein
VLARGGAGVEAAVVLAVAVGADDQDGVDGAVLDGERVEQCADGAAASRTTAPGSQAQASRRLGHAAEPAGVTTAGSS